MSKCVDVRFLCAGIALAFGSAAAAADLAGTNLATTYGVKSGGALVVLGPEGSWDGKHGKETVYDGDTSTFIDPTTETDLAGNGWAGFETTMPVIPVRVRYWGRPGYVSRAKGCLFQGANTADFSDAVTLHVANPPNGWKADSWVEVTLPFDPQFRAFRYLRVIGPTPGTGGDPGMCGGNMAEVEFYGTVIIPDDPTPSKPAPTIAEPLNGHMNIRVAVPASVLGVSFQRKPLAAGDGDWADVFDSISWNTAASTQTLLDGRLTDDTAYRVAFVNGGGTSDWFTVEASPRNYADGTRMGTKPWPSNPNSTYDKAFDGNVATFYTGDVADGRWAGLDLGQPRRVVAIRYTPRGSADYERNRMKGGRFQHAANADFSDAQDIHTIASAPSALAVTTVTLPEPVEVGRYVRYLSANGNYGDIGEVEFELDATPLTTPQDFAVTRSDLTNQHAVVSWTADTRFPWQVTRVFRAFAEDGPFEVLAEVPRGTTTYTDETCLLGVRCFYRAAVVNDGVEGAVTPVVAYRRCRRLDRDWSDLTHLADGLTLITEGVPWGGGDANAGKWFDGNTSTYGDLDPPTGAAANAVYGGIDFGDGNKAGVGFVRLITRDFKPYAYDWMNGSALYGSNESNWKTPTVTLLMLSTISGTWWYEFTSHDATMCRYIYFHKTSGNNHAALAELEVYGWTEEDIKDVVLAPPSLKLEVGVGPVVQLTWAAGYNAEEYRVERKVNDGAWAPLATVVSGTSYVDRSVDYVTGRYTYRVVSVKGAAEAVSDPVSKAVWQPGSGKGLHAVYRYPYTDYGDSSEAVVLETTDPVIDFNWGGGTLVPGLPAATDKVGVTWSGRLIVPFEGDYVFSTVHNDAALVLIDGKAVINEYTTKVVYSSPVHLTAGEHSLRVDYREKTEAARIGLYWSGAIDEAGIPQSQFVPAPATLPAPWAGERTYGNVKFGWTDFADAAHFTITGAGSNFWQGNSSGHYVWQRQEGDFICTFRFAVNAGWDDSSKILLVARNAADAASPLFAGALQPMSVDFAIGKYRTPATDGIVDSSSAWAQLAGDKRNGWMRMVRKGNVFTCSYRLAESQVWTPFATYTDANGDFARELLVGVQMIAGTKTAEPLSAEISDFEIRQSKAFVIIVQ